MSERITRGSLIIAVDQCKGCELCIPACPPGVLEMSLETNSMGFRFPKLKPGCTACSACQLVCPDFVFDVFRFDTPVSHNDSDTSVANQDAGVNQ